MWQFQRQWFREVLAMYQVTFRYNGTETEWMEPLKAAQVMAAMRESRTIDPSATFKYTKIADRGRQDFATQISK
jgi:hypothetical protein